MSAVGELEILYREPGFVVVSKPGGLLAVPGRGADKQDCVVSRVRTLFPHAIAQPSVHRLDMATSGLMVLGLSKSVHRHLSMQFAARSVVKRYLAVIEGQPGTEAGVIRLRFRLDPENRPHQVYDPEQGKLGVSHWRLLGLQGERAVLELFPQTGRTHQLRLHTSHPLGLAAPIVGDPLYGTGREGDRLLLHAAGLQFLHPESEEPLCFFSPPPFRVDCL
ncbi:RluA family pseudouridine synthase [Desulfogranum mediterraneum]|uniref:RluA family pseudouridine synthase n=1 Tax=Desulfogranum mediterraneum TaxID=160661 RepID=UPI00049119DF|nr:RluA family pseudouridine synthase [Desulfogranum mediterraneum]